MSRLLQRLNVLAIWLLSGVLASVLAARIWPLAGQFARAGATDDERAWPKTLQVYPSHGVDPVTLIRIMKDGKQVGPERYTVPHIAGDGFQNVDAVKEWLRDVSFTLKSQTSKSIVSLGDCRRVFCTSHRPRVHLCSRTVVRCPSSLVRWWVP